MSPVVYEQYDPTNPTHVTVAGEIQSWQADDRSKPDYEQMLALSNEKLAEHVLGIIAYDTDGSSTITGVGYGAATYAYEGDVFESGGLIVNPAYRGQGVATNLELELMSQLAADYPGHKLVSFVNHKSDRLFRELDFHEATREEVPDEALAVCEKECINYQRCVVGLGQICCDTILIRELSPSDIIDGNA